MDRFKSERRKFAASISEVHARAQPNLPSFDAPSRELYEKALPRGVLLPRLEPDRERINYWMSPAELLGNHRYQPGHIILGKLAGTVIGHLDDRPMVTTAGARAGKTTTVLEPNLYLYPGSMLVLDPKGELARSASFRRAIGHDVYVLDPFGQSGEPSASFNPLAELDPNSPNLVDDVASIVNALVPDSGDARSKHWDEGARTLLIGIILLTLCRKESERNLITVREILCLTYEPLVMATKAQETILVEASREGKSAYFDANGPAIKMLLGALIKMGKRFGGIAAGIGRRFNQLHPPERSGIFSTAATHIDFLDSLPVRAILRRSDFRLSDLRGDRPATIFICLPVGRMERHSPWMRLVVQLACLVLENMGAYPRDRPPILFMIEEFATLGHMEIMERAAAYFPGFGVKLWAILQDITQLKRNYRESWETFLGNAGLVQLFANGDGETLRYVESRLEKLIAPFEIETAFSRERGSQMLLINGLPGAAALRLTHEDVALIRTHAEAAAQSRFLLPPR